MASWNDKNQGEQLESCPVCQCKLQKKKRAVHLTKCWETHKDQMKEIGVVQCPLYRLHILPQTYLNHHLESCCEEAQNRLRKFMQNGMPMGFTGAPDSFMADTPDHILNKHNKALLYLLERDLNGDTT